MPTEENENNAQGVVDQQGAQGAAGTENQNNENQNASENKDEAKEKTFTQHQVTAMMSKEKKQGKASVYNELGIDPNDAKTIAMVKALVEANKTDEQKKAEVSAQQAAKIAEAERRAMMAESKATAMQLGVKPEYVDDCITVALSKVTDTNTLEDALKELKTKYPIWFGNSDSTGDKGTGSTIGNRGNSNSSSSYSGMGKKLAEAKKSSSNTNAKSFWG